MADEVQATAPVEPLPVRVTVVHFERAAREWRFPALIAPRYESDLGFRVPGKIIERQVEVGDIVDNGKILAQLDPSDLLLQERSAASGLAAAEAESAVAQTDLQRVVALEAKRFVSTQTVDRQQADATTAAQRLAQARSNFKMAQDNQSYATLIADRAGVVSRIMAEPGQYVAPGQPVVTLALLDGKEVTADIPEQDISILAGARLSVELWSEPGAEIPGKLRLTAPIADSGARTFQVRVTLLVPAPSARFGMTATLIARQEDGGQAVAKLPAGVLTAMNGAPAVWVIDPGRDVARRQPVSIAGYTADSVLIRDGVKEGEQVVTAGVQKIDAGTKVRIWTEPLR